MQHFLWHICHAVCNDIYKSKIVSRYTFPQHIYRTLPLYEEDHPQRLSMLLYQNDTEGMVFQEY